MTMRRCVSCGHTMTKQDLVLNGHYCTVSGTPHPLFEDVLEWRPIPAFPKYVLSSDGRVKSLATHRILPTTKGGRTKAYPRVHLYGANKTRRHAYIHVLICEVYHGPKPGPEYQACHRDDDASNNTVDNLYWGTREQNEADRAANSSTSEPDYDDGVPF